jgi:hypothetical protein
MKYVNSVPHTTCRKCFRGELYVPSLPRQTLNFLPLLSQLVGEPEKYCPFRRMQFPAIKARKEGLFPEYFEAFLAYIVRTTCPFHHNQHFTILTILESLLNNEVSF